MAEIFFGQNARKMRAANSERLLWAVLKRSPGACTSGCFISHSSQSNNLR